MDTFCLTPVTRKQIGGLLESLKGKSTVVQQAPDQWDVKGRVFFLTIETCVQYDEANQALTVHVLQGPAGRVEAELKERLGLKSCA